MLESFVLRLKGWNPFVAAPHKKFKFCAILMKQLSNNFQVVIHFRGFKILTRSADDGGEQSRIEDVTISDSKESSEFFPGIFKILQIMSVPDDLKRIHLAKANFCGDAMCEMFTRRRLASTWHSNSPDIKFQRSICHKISHLFYCSINKQHGVEPFADGNRQFKRIVQSSLFVKFEISDANKHSLPDG